MRLLHAAVLVPLAAACTPQGPDVTQITNTVPAEDIAACVSATAAEAEVPEALVTVTSFKAEETGPALTMDAGGVTATCKLNAEGEVTSVTL